MSTALAPVPQALDASVVQQVLLGGDLSRLTADQRVSYYKSVCESLGLNPLTQPFAYIRLNGKEVLYARKDATDQLRALHGISVSIVAREVLEGVCVVTAAASMPNGRRDESTGAVPIEGLKGEARANALMKAETKAKRRVTMSICGLGMLDETELETVPSVRGTPVAALPAMPDGYDDWWATCEAAAVDGLEALGACWTAADRATKAYTHAARAEAWARLKTVAAQAAEEAR